MNLLKRLADFSVRRCFVSRGWVRFWFDAWMISFFLPAIGTGIWFSNDYSPGYVAFEMAFVWSWLLPKAFVYTWFWTANVPIAFVPWLARRTSNSLLQRMFTGLLCVFAVWPLIVLLKRFELFPRSRLLIGYYLWEFSMLCIAAWFLNANFIAERKPATSDASVGLTLASGHSKLR